jgi:protein involved in polysaccharide export with SLBB domain
MYAADIRVRLLGCVSRHGEVVLSSGSTVRDAIDAAGGMGRRGLLPSGVITIRSPRGADGEYAQRLVLDVSRSPKHLGARLEDGDHLIVQYDVSGDSGGL